MPDSHSALQVAKILPRHDRVRVLARFSETRVQHVERHLVALLCSSDGDEALVVVVLRLVDLDDAARKLSNFVDLGTTLSNDGADHVVGNEDLLRNGLSWNHALHGLLRWAGMLRGRSSMAV